jgi:NADH dehydrogenase [ubiquinone] 1 alpha subcomplex assembly factor 7
VTPLETEIRRIIAVDGPISISHYMALALTHPTCGYYSARDPFGAKGDFVTAPEISQMFGELLGLWSAAVWQRMGAPARLNLVELGPGRGSLMADALRALMVVPKFRGAIDIHLVEASARRRAQQQELLSGLGLPISWHADIGSLPDGPLIVIANEFFDALPVQQAVKGPRGWHERMVGLDEDRDCLVYALHPEPVRGLEPLLPVRIRAAPSGALYEWRADHIVTELAGRIARFGGVALAVDYGHLESGIGDTLQAVRGHEFMSPLEAPGEVDITAHVDFSALMGAAERGGARVFPPVPQGVFLTRLGIAERARMLKAKATPAQAANITAALTRLTASGATGMGELFKAVAFAHPDIPPLPGFDT